MLKRKCPICGETKSNVIMKFTPEILCTVNPSYKLDVLKNTVHGKEEFITYSKCCNCGMIFCENVWDQNVLMKIYKDTIDHSKSREKILYIEKRLSLLRIWGNALRLLRVSGREKIENLKVIDFGCGWGDFLDVANGSGVSVMGYDEDDGKTILAKERGYKIAANLEELKSFGPADIILMNSVLEHLQDDVQYVNLIKKLLKKDGLFIFSVMDYRSKYIKNNIKALNNNLPPLTKNLNPLEHVNIYDFHSIMAFVKKYNLEFITTGHALYLTDFFGIRYNMKVLKFVNWIEKILSRFIKNKEMSITIYARK